jgi:hypothetical protein
LTQLVVVLAALAVLLLAGLAIARRPSLIGLLVGVLIGAGGLILLAAGLFDFSGIDASTGQMFVSALIGLAVAVTILVVALYLAAARAGRRTSDLEPW